MRLKVSGWNVGGIFLILFICFYPIFLSLVVFFFLSCSLTLYTRAINNELIELLWNVYIYKCMCVCVYVVTIEVPKNGTQRTICKGSVLLEREIGVNVQLF
jgi:hypothetical protein